MPVTDIPDVELVATGTWGASTGRATITRDDLESVLAAHNDALIDRAPVKLGHTSQLNAGIDEGHPAYGWVTPERIVDRPDGSSVLVGTLKGVPAKLAAELPHAYRRRSVELAQRVKTSSGRTYRAVLTAVALLGQTPPAVKNLADVLAYYSDGDTIAEADRVTLTGDDTPNVPHDPSETTDDGGDKAEQADHTTPPGKGPAMMTEAQVREALNMQADADVKIELQRLLEQFNGAAKPAEESGDSESPVRSGEQGEAATSKTGVEQTEAQAAAEGEVPVAKAADVPVTHTLSDGQWREVQALLTDARSRRNTDLVDGAIAKGKIVPAERDVYLSAAERDYDTTATLIGGLASKFSTSESGYDNAQATSGNPDLDAKLDAWERGENL